MGGTVTPLAAAPTLRGALRGAASDLYYHSIRIVPVNLVFAVGVFLAVVAWAAGGAVVGLAAAILLAVPLAGLARLGALATRGEDVNLSDALGPLREQPLAVLGAGAGFLGATVVLAVNVAAGIAAATPVGIALATLAFWGLLTTLAVGFAFWPLLADPARAGRPARAAVRLAGLLVLAHPVRLLGLTAVLMAILLASIVAFAAILTVSVGFVLAVACRYVLPAADRLEARLAEPPDTTVAGPT